jgi:cbb3-type cytochrome oxidase maturation protein
MNSPTEGPAFLFIWIGFLLLMTGSIAAFFLWAIRAGQFSGQERARYLPLTSGITESEEKSDNEPRQERGRPFK